MRKTFVLVPALLLGAIAACSTVPAPDLSGMSFSDEPLKGKVVWNDLVTEDMSAAKDFYGSLFDWTFVDTTTRDGADYVLARQGDVFVAGIIGVAPRPDGVKLTRWLPYMSVDDVDDAVLRSESAGAQVVVDARNVNVGRVAAIIDPEGAVIGLARSKIGDPDDDTTRPAPGRVVWSELLSSDPAAAAEFYGLLAGLESEVISRRGGEYTLLSANGVNRAGILARPNEMIEPTWLTYIGVPDPSAAVEKAEALGGTVLLAPDPELRDGSMAVITDPTGAVLVLQKTTS